MRHLNFVAGNSTNGIHASFFKWGAAVHVELRGKTYGGSWSL
jgi:hypothetical protein